MHRYWCGCLLQLEENGTNGCIYSEAVAWGHMVQHYENMPMQYTEIVKVKRKNENFYQKNFDIFRIFQNIDCGYTLELPRRGGSNEYLQSMFWSKNKKNRYTPAYPSFTM